MDSMNRLKWIVALMRNAIVSRQSIGDTTRKKDDFIYCIIFKSGTMSDNVSSVDAVSMASKRGCTKDGKGE